MIGVANGRAAGGRSDESRISVAGTVLCALSGEGNAVSWQLMKMKIDLLWQGGFRC